MDVGVISDTHGYLDPKIFKVFQGVDHILHAGDLGTEEVATELEAMSPLTAVSGNVDVYLPSGRFPPLNLFEAEGWRILVIHVGMFDGSPAPGLDGLLREKNPDLVIFGHSHQPFFGQVGEYHFFNPGSAGKKRFSLPRTVGRLEVTAEGELSGRLISLEGRSKDEMNFILPGRRGMTP
jgi:putative phosphoesterase